MIEFLSAETHTSEDRNYKSPVQKTHHLVQKNLVT